MKSPKTLKRPAGQQRREKNDYFKFQLFNYSGQTGISRSPAKTLFKNHDSRAVKKEVFKSRPMPDWGLLTEGFFVGQLIQQRPRQKEIWNFVYILKFDFKIFQYRLILLDNENK